MPVKYHNPYGGLSHKIRHHLNELHKLGVVVAEARYRAPAAPVYYSASHEPLSVKPSSLKMSMKDTVTKHEHQAVTHIETLFVCQGNSVTKSMIEAFNGYTFGPSIIYDVFGQLVIGKDHY